MTRASIAQRPVHACCPSAMYRLDTFSLAGRWNWRIAVRYPRDPASGRRGRVFEYVHISHCPWCGIELPSVRTPQLREASRHG